MSIAYDDVSKYAADRFKQAYERGFLLQESTREAAFAKSLVVTIEQFEDRLAHVTDFAEQDCCALFIDMRKSTYEFARHGAGLAYVWVQTFMATMGYIVQNSATGTVVDYVGDGLYALFIQDVSHDLEAILTDAGATACMMMTAATKIVNPLMKKCVGISKIGIVNPFDYGIGIDSGRAVITRIGTDRYGGVVAIGQCINNACKTANGIDKVVVSRAMHNSYPKSKGGKMQFHVNTNGTSDLLWGNYEWT